MEKIILLLLSGLLTGSAFGQLDITSKLNSPTALANATNSTAGPGVFSWHIDQTAVYSVNVIGTNANAVSNIVVRLDTSVNGTDWKASQYNIVLTPSGLTAVTTIGRITNTVGGQWLRFGTLESTNDSSVTLRRFTWHPKEQ